MSPGRPAAVARLPSNVAWVGGGVVVYGLSSFGFLVLAGQSMGQGPGYTALALMWTLLNALGIGLYLPVEQDAGRTVASLTSLGRPTSSGVIGPLRYAGGSLLLITVGAAFGHRMITVRLFEGHGGMASVFVLGLAGMAGAYLLRGVLAGTGRFPRYGAQLTIDGILRLMGAAVLAMRGETDPLYYGAVLALAPALASALSLVGGWRLLSRAPGRHRHGPVLLAPLVLASLASQALANVGPIAAQLLKATSEEAAAANLVNALTVARIPLFLFAAVQAVFLPALAGHVAVGARSQYVRVLRTTGWSTAGFGVLGVLACWLVGPEAVRLLFGPTFAIGRLDVVLLAVSAVLFMLAQVVVQGLLARSRDLLATISWGAGLGCFLAALVLPLSLTTRVATALVVGSLGALAAAALALRAVLDRWPEEVTHGPS